MHGPNSLQLNTSSRVWTVSALCHAISDQLKAHFGDKVFNTIIPRNVRLAEAPSYGMPGLVFDPSAKGSQAFLSFAQELVARAPSL